MTNKYLKNIKITQFIVEDISSNLFNILEKLKPNPPLNSLAVTGTNGKTSVIWYISQILFYNKIDSKTYGTLGYFNNLKKKENSRLTTPEYDVLYQTAFSKKKNKINYLFEVSSHALDQNRLKNFPINIAAITNISHDHLDYHKNLKNYRNAKIKLFTKFLKKDGYAVINDKIKESKNIKLKIRNNRIVSYGKKNSDIFIYYERKKLKLKYFNINYTLILLDLSEIELENLSCAIACCYCLNISVNNIIKIIKKITSPPGRLQGIYQKNKNITVYIDYAHTPDALKKVLINQIKKKQKPNILFGCGGDRDKEKRRLMGEIADKFSNKVYITDDNPRNENPKKIRNMIINFCKKAIEIGDRKKAIIKAINDLKNNEILIIAGKGHEKFQIINNKKKLFDDFVIAKNELKKLYG